MTKHTQEFATVGDAIAARNERLFAEQAQRKGAGKVHTAVKERVKAVKPLKPSEISAKYAGRRRVGKTAMDHANGNARRNAERKQARAEWQHDNRASASNFPV